MKFTRKAAFNYAQLRGLQKYVKGTKGFIAGGCFKDLFLGKKLRDVDIFFQNEEDRELFINAGFIDPSLTTRLPGSGVDLQRFKQCPLPNDGSMRFLLVARLLYEKGVETYVQAAEALRAKYPHVECRVVGMLDAKNPSAIPREVVEGWHKAGKIIFRGSTDTVEIEIAQAHCIVLPSYYREGVPRSLLEGAAMGRPVITSDNIGCRETVNPGVSGYICKPRDTESLIDAMEAIVTLDKTKLASMANASRTWIEQAFDEKLVHEKYIQHLIYVVAT